ncbi:MAG: hypothetical protein V1738_03290 [Patescibacteria group bacterium]
MRDEINGKVQEMWLSKLNFWQKLLRLVTFGLVFGKPPRYEMVTVNEPGPDTVSVGNGPERSVYQRIVFDKPVVGAWRGMFTAVDRFLGRRDVQLAFRLSLIPMFIYLIYWAWTIFTGGTVSVGTTHVLTGFSSHAELLSVSRLTDVPAVFLFISAVVFLFGGRFKLVEKSKAGFSEGLWQILPVLSVVLGSFVVSSAYYFELRYYNPAYANDAAAVNSIFVYIPLVIGAICGFASMSWGEHFKIKTIISFMHQALVVLGCAVPIGFGEGWLTALLVAAYWFAASAIGFAVLCALGVIRNGCGLANVGKWFIRGLASVSKWLIADDMAKKSDE